MSQQLTWSNICLLLSIKDTLKDPILITINEDLDNVSEEKLAKIIRKELEIFLLELGCNRIKNKKNKERSVVSTSFLGMYFFLLILYLFHLKHKIFFVTKKVRLNLLREDHQLFYL